MIPANALPLLPLLAIELATHFPQFVDRPVIAAQIEHESCISLKHSRCWNPRSELKTKREWGVGLGQVTTAYHADGSVRFDKGAELRAQYKAELKDFKGEGMYDARLQLRAVALLNRQNWLIVQGAADPRERGAFMLASYNSGAGMVRKDRVLCANTAGCNPGKWFGNVERQGFQSKTKWQGYGKSAFEITRHYVPDIMDTRARRYKGMV